jgi:hypothetical protein
MSENDHKSLDESRRHIVRAELDHLVESPSFRQSKRCRDFLDYIVEHTLSGPSGALKERSIGVELFQLPTDFDTGVHTIVRVTANEVRKKLARHYLSENGTPHPVKIDLPPGAYSAEFTWGIAAVKEPAPPDIPAIAESRFPAEIQVLPGIQLPPQDQASKVLSARQRPVFAFTAIFLVLAGSVAVWRWPTGKPVVGDANAASSLNRAVSASTANASLRMSVGSQVPYNDRGGRTWGPDRFFTGGTIFVRSTERILRTLDPDIYRHVRQGEFRYDIPLEPGSYELHLHFAETGLADFISAESSGEGQRLFSVSANGKPLLELFDVVADAAGSNTADERIFRNISPDKDGFLHLDFLPRRGTAILSAIELLPVRQGQVRPLRIRAGWTNGWQDSGGQQWQADSYFLGGNALVRATNPALESNSIPDMALYASERWGHFTYALPVAEGRYRLTLRFCEGHYGGRNAGVGGVGSRVFDVYSNGVALMRNFDIFKQAGGEGRPLERTFAGLRPNAQGKIILSFVPITGMACVNGIEVVEEAN